MTSAQAEAPDEGPALTLFTRLDDESQATLHTQEKGLFISLIMQGIDTSGSQRLRDIWELRPVT